MPFEQASERFAGELTALIGIEDGQGSMFGDGFLDRVQAKSVVMVIDWRQPARAGYSSSPRQQGNQSYGPWE
nr:hypothetical protein [Pseudomonas alcaligenes]